MRLSSDCGLGIGFSAIACASCWSRNSSARLSNFVHRSTEKKGKVDGVFSERIKNSQGYTENICANPSYQSSCLKRLMISWDLKKGLRQDKRMPSYWPSNPGRG